MSSELAEAVNSCFGLGFTSLDKEIDLDSLPVEGTIPAWLGGSLFRNGPAKFEIGDQSYSHWFDGLAMLHRYSFHRGQVSYRNRLLQTKTYQKAITSGKPGSEFATTEASSLAVRIFNLAKLMVSQQAKDGFNANVSLMRLADHFLALTEPPAPTIFDPRSLEVGGVLQYADKLSGQVSTPHPHYDFAHKQYINYLIQYSRQPSYKIYRVADNSITRHLIGSIPVNEPAYMHSFASTENYVILTEFPFVVKPFSMMTSGKPYIENFEWKPEQGTKFRVMSKKSGELVGTFQSEAFFAFHHVNAFEQGGDIFIDVCASPDAKGIYGGYLAKVRVAESKPGDPRARLRRYHVPLSAGASSRPDVDYEPIADEAIDLPGLNLPQYFTKTYRYTYGVSSNKARPEPPSNQLVKIDVQQGTAKTWFVTGCYPGEPIFVNAPSARTEDDGVLLSVVLDGRKGHSFLLVLDAATFEELGRANLPHHVPFEFHGLYASDVNYRP